MIIFENVVPFQQVLEPVVKVIERNLPE